MAAAPPAAQPAFQSSFPPTPPASVGLDPPGSALLPPPPATYGAPPAELAPAEPAASIAFNTTPLNQVSSLLANLSVSKGTDVEPDGTGVGVSVRSVLRARHMDSLTTRLAISAAVERNRTAPQQVIEGYNVTHVSDTLTVAHNAQVEKSEEEQFFDARTLPDNSEWLHTLRHHRQNGTQFTDPQFPPDVTSLYKNPTNKKFPHLEELVWKWKRISDFFNETAYVEITMIDDAKQLVCSIAMKSPAEAESILSILQQNPPNSVDPAFLQTAQDAVTTGLTKRKRDHLLLCTKNMIHYLSEYVQDGLQRYDLLWEKSLLEHYKPLAFVGLGQGAGYRVDGAEAGLVSRVSVLVPVLFRAQGTCVFDRSRAVPSAVSGVGIEPGELRLGRLADAYLFGALSILSTSPTALAQAFPLLEPDVVKPDRVEIGSAFPTEQQYNEEGVYAVRFWRGNRSRVVLIDDFIPCSQYGKPVFGSFTGSNGKFEIWSVLIEKAYAKLHGGYEAIIGGQEAYALQDLFGGVPVTYKLQETGPTEEQAWQAIGDALQAGSLVGVTNDSVDLELPRGLQKSAAYGVLQLVELDYKGERVRLIQLRNSWGTGTTLHPDKWTGSWSNADPKWHALSRVQKVECGFQFREDATYWLDFGACFCFFSSVIESRNLYNFQSIPDGLGNPIHPTLSVHVVSSEWRGLTSGGRDAMHLNPQVQLVSPAAAGCQITVHLEQPSRRIQSQGEYPAYIAPVVFRNGSPSQRKIDLGAGDLVATGTFISNRSCVLSTSLDHATSDASHPFVVLAATYDRLAEPLPFSLTLFTSKPTALATVSDSSSLPICCVCQRALSGSFRTFTLQTPGQEADARMNRVCNDCVPAYRDRNTPVCVHCHERIEQVNGRFSGRMFTLPDGVSVHAECVDAYRIRIADKCVHCGQAIAAVPGKFDGKFFELPGGDKCHAECMDAYQLATATRCMHCCEPVAKTPGKFDGRFYKLANDQELVHFECWDAYQASIAPKCVHCSLPIVVVPARFDGRFYELTSGLGKVHFECWETYQTSQLRR